MAKLIADAELSRSSAIPGPRDRSNELETVSITLVTPQSNSVLLLDSKSGWFLLERLEKDCVDNEALHWDLSYFQSRIHY